MDLGLINNNKWKYFIKQREYSYNNNIQEPIKNLYYSEKLRKFY